MTCSGRLAEEWLTAGDLTIAISIPRGAGERRSWVRVRAGHR